MSVPATPINLAAQQGNGQVYLTWDISAGATNYPVLRSTDNVTFTLLATATTNNYLDIAATVGVEYWYQVQAHNANGNSNVTPSVSVIPALTGDMSLGQLRDLAKQRADRVNSNFITDPEWNSYITQSAFELYDLLIGVYEDYSLAVPLQFATDGSTFQYPLPDGSNYNQAPAFYKLMGVDLGLDNSNNAWVTLKKFDFIQRNRYVYPNITSTFLGVFNLRYRVVGSTLYFIPVPSGNQIIRLWYIPRMRQPLKDTDILDGISGWTEYVIVDAAIKALQKEESDVSVLMLQKNALKMRIEELANNRDAGQPDTISGTRRWGDSSGGYGGPGFDGSFGGY